MLKNIYLKNLKRTKFIVIRKLVQSTSIMYNFKSLVLHLNLVIQLRRKEIIEKTSNYSWGLLTSQFRQKLSFYQNYFTNFRQKQNFLVSIETIGSLTTRLANHFPSSDRNYPTSFDRNQESELTPKQKPTIGVFFQSAPQDFSLVG